MKNIFGHIKDIMIIFGLIGGAYAGYIWVQDKGRDEAVKEELMFPDSETKHRTIIHVKDTEEVIDELKDLLDSKTDDNKSRIKSRAKRDSIQLEYLDLAKRNAVTTHQNKQATDSILKLWEKYNAENE